MAESAEASAPAGTDFSPPATAALAGFRVRLLARREVAAAVVVEEAPALVLFLGEVLLVLVAVALGFAALPPPAFLDEAFLLVFAVVAVGTGLVGVSSRSTSSPRLALSTRTGTGWGRGDTVGEEWRRGIARGRC